MQLSLGQGVATRAVLQRRVFAVWFAASGSLPAWLSGGGAANGTRFNGANIVAATGGPRFEPIGLRWEAAAQNLVLQHALAASWTVARASVSTAFATGPDGANSATRLIADATASSTHLATQLIAFTAGQVVTFSAFLKKAGPFDWSHLRMSNPAFGVTPQASFNLVTGVVGTFGGCTARITAFPNGWYLCEITATATANASSTCGVNLVQADGGSAITFSGDGATAVLIWGAQVEIGDYASSRVLNGAASLTRGADILTAIANQTRPARVYLRSIRTGVESAIFHAQLSNISSAPRGNWITRIDLLQ